uniref:Uncharacterized protein n=1 Tax=Knipowitschia caucasica TaxID=637954 RepID=A0AAV2MQS5_KNICA
MIRKFIGKSHEVPDTEQQIHLVQMLRKVENGVKIPQDSQLTDKDLKTIGKATAKSSLQECGSVSALISIGTGLEEDHFDKSGILGKSAPECAGEHQGRQKQRVGYAIQASPR